MHTLPQNFRSDRLKAGRGGLAPAATLDCLIPGLPSTQGPGRIQSATQFQKASGLERRVQHHDGGDTHTTRKPRLS